MLKKTVQLDLVTQKYLHIFSVSKAIVKYYSIAKYSNKYMHNDLLSC